MDYSNSSSQLSKFNQVELDKNWIGVRKTKEGTAEVYLEEKTVGKMIGYTVARIFSLGIYNRESDNLTQKQN